MEADLLNQLQALATGFAAELHQTLTQSPSLTLGVRNRLHRVLDVPQDAARKTFANIIR